jgi:hypothetical protein
MCSNVIIYGVNLFARKFCTSQGATFLDFNSSNFFDCSKTTVYEHH